MRDINNFMFGFAIFPVLFLLALPASTNYELRSYGFGAGGGSLDSASYSLEGILGEQSASVSSNSYNVRGGLLGVQTAHVPPAPTLVNSDNWYNKLNITLDQGGNPSDTVYAIAISNDAWVTTNWVQSDNTVGATLGIEDYQTYADWGSGSGENIIGLDLNTTYWVRVKAMQGEFSESQLGPQASAATSNVSIDFDIDVSASDTETAAPYAFAFGTLTVGSVNTPSTKVWVDLDTNAQYGGYIYLSDSNSGLLSADQSYTIDSATGDLAALGEGFGVQSSTDTESSGGPLTAIAPYNNSSENVGVLDTTVRELYSTAGSSIAGGRGSFLLKAKPSNTAPAADDYTDTLTIIAAGNF